MDEKEHMHPEQIFVNFGYAVMHLVPSLVLERGRKHGVIEMRYTLTHGMHTWKKNLGWMSTTFVNADSCTRF